MSIRSITIVNNFVTNCALNTHCNLLKEITQESNKKFMDVLHKNKNLIVRTVHLVMMLEKSSRQFRDVLQVSKRRWKDIWKTGKQGLCSCRVPVSVLRKSKIHLLWHSSLCGFLFETFLSERSSSKSYQELLRESIAKYFSFNPEADIFCNCTLSSLNNLCCRLFDIKLDLQDKKEFDKRSLSVADDVSFYLWDVELHDYLPVFTHQD